MIGLFVSFRLILGASLNGVIETPIENLDYHPGIYNDHIGIQNVIVKSDKLLLRSTIDDGSMVRWELPNTKDNWSFMLKFNELNLESRESAGIHVFYTHEKPTIGSFKGGPSKYNGFMVGLEFVGKSLELVYAKNNGEDYTNMDEYVSTVDSLNPQRFANIDTLTMKVICTKNNFKVEIYDGETLVYDNFKFFTKEYIDNHKKGGYISTFANYKNVSSGKAFELHEAQLYEREETPEYSPSLSRMEKIIPQIKNRNEVIHSNVDIQDLIFKVSAVTNYIKSVIGELPETAITKAEKELTKEVDMIVERFGRFKNGTSNKPSRIDLNKKVNHIDIQFKAISKKLSDVDFLIDTVSEKRFQKTWAVEYLIVLLGSISAIILIIKETRSFINSTRGKPIK